MHQSLDKKYIENIVAWIIKNKDITYPLSFSNLMKKYENIKVFLTDASKLTKDNVSGLVKRTDTWNYEIYLNKKQSHQRMAFTLAHELWHIVLEHFKDQDFFIDKLYRKEEVFSVYPRKEEDKILEAQANYFAACLLMPEQEVRQQWEKNRKIADLAQFFNVSEDAIGTRVNSLGLLN